MASQLEEAQKQTLKIKEDQTILANELKLNSKIHQTELSGVQSQYQDKVLALEQQITKMTKDHLDELATSRQRYEQKLVDQDQAMKRERQTFLTNENLLRKQIDELTEKLSEEQRNNSRSSDEVIVKINRGSLLMLTKLTFF